MIPQQFIEEVQSRTDIVELISSYVPLKRTGRNFKATCPFHGEKTPSFIVSPQKQIFHCFGCGQGGGIYQFLTLIEKVNFPEAVEMLAKRLGLAIPYNNNKTAKTKTILYDAANEASLFFHEQLKNNKYYQQIVNYLKERKINEAAIDKFRIGFAPPNNALLAHMRNKGFTLEILEKASLAISQNQGFRDLFRDRIMFPIFDVRARVVGFGARIWRSLSGAPKYINSLENALYSKRDHLFGLSFAKDDIARENLAIVTEGYLDMIVPFMAGIKNVVASLGTALTVEQIRLIKRYTTSVVLLFDSDKAGKAAALRTVDLLLENDLKVEVVDLPSGFDPDSLVTKQGKDALLKLITLRKDFLDYKLDILKGTHDIKTIDGKSKIAKDILLTIDKLNSEIEKYEYIRRFSSLLDIKEEILIAEFKKLSKSDSQPKNRRYTGGSYLTDQKTLSNELISITERILLKCMIVNQKAFLLVKKNLKEEDFNSFLARRAVAFFFHNHKSQDSFSLSKFIGTIDDKEVSSLISELLMNDDIPLDKDAFKESLFKLRRRGSLGAKKILKEKIKEAEANKDKQKLIELVNEYSRINKEVKHG
jgi:DNA primase